ncbi:unnamed protein product [Diatraea saccharalis]|uniref:Beta-hexosaminidase n=1 Tax=Diatraea saccharalis TaxID=40085 RepID=A0A9N9WDP1_9NEOP|nr:unnamed protein product [Diatraea saccharalis]
MMRNVKFYFGFCIVLTNGMYIVDPGPRYPPTKGEVWPKPQYERKENYYLIFDPARLEVNTTALSCNILTNAVKRYAFIVKRELNTKSRQTFLKRRRKHTYTVTQDSANDVYKIGALTKLEIELLAPCQDYPYFGMDESYELFINDKARLSSMSIWGILRGLETWSQLFYFSDDYNEIRINQTHIADYPRYSHRGLLLDTSRHYVSLSNILRTLDAMSMNKMNVFHWHIVDDQSFPYQSQMFPDLSAKGAFHQSMIYSKYDIGLVVNYARDRGIRVMPEFDVPGHTRSWGNAYPGILTECYINNQVVGLGPMNPINNATYRILEDLIKEVQQWFPDKYFHVGGDEVELECWKSNPELQKYMTENKLTAAQLHALFMKNVLPLLGSSKAVVWQEVFDEGVPLNADTLIQVWKNDWVYEMIKVLRAGHNLIFSSSWYLDHLKSGGDWFDYYVADPREMVSKSIGNDSTLLKQIVGGEACMWGEVVDDANVISRVWPRASATAERLWSAPMVAMSSNSFSTTNARTYDPFDTVRQRLEEHTCRMRRRGIRAQPPNGPGFCVGAVN